MMIIKVARKPFKFTKSSPPAAAIMPSWKGAANSCPGTRALRRRFANGCLDWSKQRPHIGGALGAALQPDAEERYVSRDLDSRTLSLTA
jgi:hypothetical protein